MKPEVSGPLDLQTKRLMSEKNRILAVDDEEDILEILSFNLTGEGYDVDTCTSAEDALRRNLASYDLFILDVMMGAVSGFRLAEKIRNELSLATPVVFLTARDTENDRITGFSLGADDYLAKPFSIRELTARVKAILRRSAPTHITVSTSAGSFTIDTENKLIYYDGKPLELTRKEHDILSLFIRNEKRIFSRYEILSRVWGNDVIVTDRTVDVTIARIRKKLGKHGNMIKNKTGYGYYLGE